MNESNSALPDDIVDSDRPDNQSNKNSSFVIGDRYRILNILGQGSVGNTYAAIDLQTQEKVAIKALSLRQLKDWKHLDLFEREARILMQLNHLAIPQYLDSFQVDSDRDRIFYIVQKLAPGKSLGQLVESGWRTTEAQVKDIAAQILDIFIYLHSLKPPVIHRDIKPDNLILSDEGKVYLVDFGAVQNTYYNTLMRGSTVVGTYGYMAPEQFQGKAQPQTDLYGLGATILYLLTHRSPAEFPHDNLTIDFRSHVNISEEFAVWLETILQPDLEDRFASAKLAKDALQSRKSIFINARSKKKVAFNLILISAIAIGGIFALKSHKWAILGHLGIQPDFFFTPNEVIKDYLRSGGDANTKDTYGNTPLHNALRDDKLEIVKLLITHGADVNAKNILGNTPLHNALRDDKLEIAKLLITHGADVNAKNKNGETPLRIASDDKEVKLLKKYGAKL